MARKDRRPYTYHCTKETPYRGGGLRDDVSILHSEAHQAFSNGRRTCRWCHADLGLNFERSWEREQRLIDLREKTAEGAKQAAELIRRVSLSLDTRNGEKPKVYRLEPLVQVEPAPEATPG